MVVFAALAIALISIRAWMSGEPDHEIYFHRHDVEEHGGHHLDVVALSKKQIEKGGIEVAFAAPGKIEQYCRVSGWIKVDPEKYAHVATHVRGIVKSARKNLGDSVKKEELLAVIESKEMAEAKGNYIAAMNRADLAREVLKREKDLYQKSVSSKQDFLDAKINAEEAEIAVELTKQRLFSFGIAEDAVGQLQDSPRGNLREYHLRSPLSGTVIQRHLSQGEVVEEMHEGYVVADLSTLWVELSIFPRDSSKFRAGQILTIVGEDGQKTEAALARLNPLADSNTGRVQGIAVLNNRSGKWRPGSYVCVEAKGEVIHASIAVPLEAVVHFEGEEVVFIESSEGFLPRPVQLGKSDRKVVEIVSGLGEGEPYVSKQAILVKFELTKGEHEH